ncbi:hypothetical protein [Halorubellus sp. PRR65]|uniref:hypothetical protein n=1 Tax=Halorubellus sp. PRR65 TaxID=3098148 RepID=UPI002B260A90|nr:hypothetical protein [Halorubellus sp. PRR65]
MSSTLHAETLFGSLRTVDDRLTRLLEVDSYVDLDVFTVADDATSALAGFGDALLEAAPFPSSSGSADSSSVDDVVEGILRTRYIAGGDASAVEVPSTERVIVRDGMPGVPLARSGPTLRNWQPTLTVLRSFVEELLSRAETVVRRVRTVDAVHARVACRAIRRMLASIRDVLARSRSGRRFVDRRADTDAETPMTFADWAGDRLTGGNDA